MDMYVAIRHDLYVATNGDPVYDCGGKLIGVYENADSAIASARAEAKSVFAVLVNSSDFDGIDYAVYDEEKIDYIGSGVLEISVAFDTKTRFIKYVIQVIKESKET